MSTFLDVIVHVVAWFCVITLELQDKSHAEQQKLAELGSLQSRVSQLKAEIKRHGTNVDGLWLKEAALCLQQLFDTSWIGVQLTQGMFGGVKCLQVFGG